MIGGFYALYVAIGAATVCMMWVTICAHVVLLMPWSVEGGRANHLSVLFMQPAAASEREKERISLDGVAPGMRAEAVLVAGAVFALGFLTIALALARAEPLPARGVCQSPRPC